MWKLMQAGVFMAVMATNIEFQWTPNPTLAAFAGVIAALWATLAVMGVQNLVARIRDARRRRPGLKRQLSRINRSGE